jgi:hypothetical protein
MKRLITAALFVAVFTIPSGVFAQYYPAPAACPAPAPVCGVCRVPTCYRTVNNPCISPDLGISRVLGHIFAPRCMPKCQPCATCVPCP